MDEVRVYHVRRWLLSSWIPVGCSVSYPFCQLTILRSQLAPRDGREASSRCMRSVTSLRQDAPGVYRTGADCPVVRTTSRTRGGQIAPSAEKHADCKTQGDNHCHFSPGPRNADPGYTARQGALHVIDISTNCVVITVRLRGCRAGDSLPAAGRRRPGTARTTRGRDER